MISALPITPNSFTPPNAAPGPAPAAPVQHVSQLVGRELGSTHFFRSGYQASRQTLIATDTLVGDAKGYQYAFQAAEALEALTAGTAPAAGVVKIGDAYFGVSLLQHQNNSFIDRAGRLHVSHWYRPATLEQDPGYAYGVLASGLLEAIVDGAVTINKHD